MIVKSLVLLLLLYLKMKAYDLVIPNTILDLPFWEKELL